MRGVRFRGANLMGAFNESRERGNQSGECDTAAKTVGDHARTSGDEKLVAVHSFMRVSEINCRHEVRKQCRMGERSCPTEELCESA